VNVGISSWEALWSRFEGDNEHLAAFRAWASYYRRQSWRNALLEHDIDDADLANELAETFPQRRRLRHEVYPDVRPALETLGRSYRLALLTNGASDLQREKIDGAGIAPYFEEILVAGDIGVAKPDPRTFTTMLTRLKIEPAEALMAGDSLRKDIAGAQAVGLRAAWINRDGDAPRDNITPDLKAKNLQEFQQKLVTNRHPNAL
jgi:putative hydrolase of the HAD superfamily